MKESTFDRLFVYFNHLFLFLLLVSVLYPLIYVTSASISDPVAVNAGRMWLFPKEVTWEGYQRVFRDAEIWIGYKNTILYTLLGTIVNLLLTIPCAYALARKDFAGRNAITLFIVFTMFFNGGLIPTFLLVKSLHMVDTVWALVLPQAAAVMNIIVSRTFFQMTVPRELEEAAEIDGCSNLRMFVKVVLPISGPIIAVMALFYGVMHWNQYFNAMIYLKDRDIFPLQLFLREILVSSEMSAAMQTGVSDLEAMEAQARIAEIVKYSVMIVSALPLLVVYPFLQRFFVKGVLIGSLKG
ncbi:carbohydrate ABC transporter permease [Cohnella fermenti]|uniref:Carbohydrate ABC transporter permease n=1 Tax=Cohnella fermenti TaxID=2565925 RepID=A0A4S4BVF7_9BACL|nr:carbohydrate ABC transporter permease [Cohnella fermenti]THF79102.1 carbohydrate ABC transporter permease [Cohnella fermenti]